MMHCSHYFILLIVGFLLIAACDEHSTLIIDEDRSERKNYIFLGHTYQWHAPNRDRVDARIEELDLSIYDGIWLGGDLCASATLSRSTVEYLDDLFDLSSPTTHWSFGNHDVRDGNFHYLREVTHKNDYYTHTESNITFLVLNSVMDRIPESENYNECESLSKQYDMIVNVLDTIQEIDHLIIMSHYVTWGFIEPELTDVPNKANSDQRWYDYLCERNSEFKELIYPKLIEVSQRGINVYMLAGDGGQKHKGFHHQTNDGIHLIISGINNTADSTRYAPAKQFNYEPDQVLICRQDLVEGTLSFEFVELNDLID